METYKIVRYFAPSQKKKSRVVKTGLSLTDARKHCNDPNSRKDGVYFDGYTKER